MSRYLDPKADVVFKKIFGERPHLLKSFLNAVLPLSEDQLIESLEYLSPEQVPHIPAFKNTIVDVKCKDVQGRIFIVEMQMEWLAAFRQRMLFNSAKAYIKQLQKGEDYDTLCPVYGLGIVNQIFEPEDPDWYHHFQIVNVKNPARVLEGLELVFLELPKFKPSNTKEKRLQVLWIRFLTELGEQTKTVDTELLGVAEIREACELSEESGYSEGELEAYDKYWDAVSTAKTLHAGAKAEGRSEGIVIGEAKGFAKGEAKGRVEGRVEGMKQAKLEIARALFAQQYSAAQISSITGLDLQDLTL